MKNYNVRNLSLEGISELYSAVSKTAPKVVFSYSLRNVLSPKVDSNLVIGQTGATSDYDKFFDSMDHRDEHNKERFNHYVFKGNQRINLPFLRDGVISVYNPERPVVEMKLGKRKARLSKIEGFDFDGNLGAGVYFDRSEAFLMEDDQDIAHDLDLMFAPNNVLWEHRFAFSDSKTHEDKERFDNLGRRVLYCDNVGCQRQIRNPCLVLDRTTGGIYHNSVCFWRDMDIKSYNQVRDNNLSFTPVIERVSLDEALELCISGELQQSS